MSNNGNIIIIIDYNDVIHMPVMMTPVIEYLPQTKREYLPFKICLSVS